MNPKTIPASERMRVALCLALVGGFLETYTYRLHGGVFANAQTGNLVLFALSILQDNQKALHYLVPIVAFLAGVFLSEAICDHLKQSNQIRWLSGLVLAEAVLLAGLPFLPANTSDTVIILLVSFVCALQFNAFQRTHGFAASTVVCTANLRNFTQHLYHALIKKEKERLEIALKYLGIIGFFVGGAVLSYWLIDLWEKNCIFVCSGILVGVHFLLLWHHQDQTS